MRRRTIACGALATLGALALLAPAPSAAGPDDEAGGDEDLVVIRAGRVITVTGEELAPGTIVVRGGRIEAVGGARVAAPPRARVLDLRDRVVMPGIVVCRTRAGLPAYERGGNRADLDAGPELVLRPGALRPWLEAGVVALGVVPSGGGVPGSAVVVRPLDGAPRVRPADAGYLRVRLTDLPGDKRVLRDALAGAATAIEKEALARAEWEKKQKAAPPGAGASETPAPATPAPAPASPARPGASTAAVDTNRFEPAPVPPALRPWVAHLQRTADAPRLLVELSRASDFVHWDETFAARLGGRASEAPVATASTPGLVRFAVWNGRETDIAYVESALAAQHPLVVCWPRLSYEAFTRTRRNVPADLTRLGARVAFVPLDDAPAAIGDLLQDVAAVHRDGLPRDAALRAITSAPAEILGLEGELGAIEKGRRADLLVLDGDPLEPGTRAVSVLLGGRVAWDANDPDQVDPAAGAEPASKPAPAPARTERKPDDKPARRAPRWLAVKNAEVHTGTGAVVRGATVLSRDGKLVAIGADIAVPGSAQVLDAGGRRVYPGLVAFDSAGLVGAPADDATDVFSLNLALGLSSGVTTVGLGTSVAKLTWGTLEGIALQEDALVKLDLAAAGLVALRAELDRVRGYLRARRAAEVARAHGETQDDPDRAWIKGRAAALERLLTGQARGVVAASSQDDVRAAARLSGSYGFHIVVLGGEEAWIAAPDLGRAGAGVVLVIRSKAPVDPQTDHPSGWSIEAGARLLAAGVPIAVVPQDRGPTLGGLGGRDLQTLNLEAAFLVRGGLSPAQAVDAITIGPARLLGVGDRVGTLEPGKDCDLIVTSGDLLEYTTLVEWTVVDGRVVYDREKDSLLRHVRPRDGGANVPVLWPRRPGEPEPPMPPRERD